MSRIVQHGVTQQPRHRTACHCELTTSDKSDNEGAKSQIVVYVKQETHRHPLELLAASPGGCTEALMFANGFTAELLVELVRARLASAHSERMVAGGR